MSKILIIPHVPPDPNLRIRSVEIARHLARTGRHDVSVLEWPSPPACRQRLAHAYSRLCHAIRTAQIPIGRRDGEGIAYISVPHIGLPFRASLAFNERSLIRLIAQVGYDCVINANCSYFPLPRRSRRSCTYVYDLVDDHISPDPHRKWRRSRRFALTEIAKADAVITISHALNEIIRREAGRSCHVVPNGVDISPLRSDAKMSVARLRDRLGLGSSPCVVYIGNHRGWYSNVLFLAGAVRAMAKERPPPRLVVVGPVTLPEMQRAKDALSSIVFTGGVPATEVNDYFHLADVGVLPFAECALTHNSLPIKVLEYGAARKRVVASRLRELQILRLPHVSLVPLSEHLWAQALSVALVTPWQQEYDHLINHYDWKCILQSFEHSVLQRNQGASPAYATPDPQDDGTGQS